MLEYFTNPFILRALVAIIIMAAISGVIGSFTVFRGFSFLIAGIAHSAMAGAALAIFLDYYQIIPHLNPLAGALLFGFIVAFIVGYMIQKNGTETVDVAVGISFAMSMSLAILFISMIREYAVQAWGLIMGDLLLLTVFDLILLIIITSLTVFLTVLFYREMLLISFDMEYALALGLRVSLYNYLMLALITLSVIVLLKGVGAILVYVFLVIPAAAANNISKTVSMVMILATLFALISGLVGLFIAFFIDVAPSALAGLIALLIYVITLFIKKSS